MRHDPYMSDGGRYIRRGDLWDGITIWDYCTCEFCSKDRLQNARQSPREARGWV